MNSFHYAATRPLQWPPNTVGRYHNTDPVLVNYLIRLAVEKRGEEYLSFPRRALFDRIGMRTMVVETDPNARVVNFYGTTETPQAQAYYLPALPAADQPGRHPLPVGNWASIPGRTRRERSSGRTGWRGRLG